MKEKKTELDFSFKYLTYTHCYKENKQYFKWDKIIKTKF